MKTTGNYTDVNKIFTSAYNRDESEACVIVGKPFKPTDNVGRKNAENLLTKLGIKIAENVEQYFENSSNADAAPYICYVITTNTNEAYALGYGLEIEKLLSL